MSIADRITSMSNNLSSAYDGIEYLGVDTTGVDKNLQNLSSMLNVVYEGLPKVSDEGISPSIEGSKVGRLKSTLKASNTQQDNTKITYKCVGTETGTYYFTYNSVNYQFTMPTITSGSVLVFDTVALKLYLDSTEVATSTGTSGTQLTFIPSPNPDYPQDIHVVKGNNTVEVCGKNKIDYENAVLTSYYGSVGTKTDNGILGGWGMFLTFATPIPAGSYTFSYKVKNNDNSNSANIQLQDINNTSISDASVNISQPGSYNSTFTTSNDIKRIRIDNGKLTTTTLIYDMQLELGSTATTYEPYNGTTYPIYLGGNVFNLIDIEENKYIASATGVVGGSSVSNVSGYILVAENSIYRLVFDYVSLLSTNVRGVCFYGKNKNYLSGTTIPMTSKNQTITIPNGASYLRFAYDKNLTDISLSTDMTPIELCKIGDYQDKLFKAIVGDTVYDTLTSEQKEGLVSGGWYKYGEIGKETLNGSENWIFSSYSNETILATFYNIKALNNSAYLSNKFSYLPSVSASTVVEYVGTNGTSVRLGVFKSRLSEETVAGLKTWLASNNVLVYYALETPTITQITDNTLISQLEALYKAQSKNGQTNVLQTNTDLPFTIYASALKGG